MSIFNYVPNEFGQGVIIPIPKGEAKITHNKSVNYRGITISPVISKVYEICLSKFMHKFLHSSERQMGFKKGVGCNNAIFSVRKVIDHFTIRNSTVSICAVDLSKAFDRISHDIMWLKLMDRRVLRYLIEVIRNWYDKMSCYVRWGGYLSALFPILAGVRQGGILSPSLFSAYVDDILIKLEKCRHGCYIRNICVNSFMYADDLILLSISIRDMQILVNLCEIEFMNIGMSINSKKTSCLRIGKRHDVIIQPIIIGGQAIEWKQELKYLGITIVSGNHFKTNKQLAKQKYFRPVNSIFGKIGVNSSAELIFSIVNIHYVPILLYAAEVVNWNAKDIRSMSFAYDQAFNKMFRTFDKNIIRSCQYYMKVLPFELLLDVRRLQFLNNSNNATKFDIDNSFTRALWLITIFVKKKKYI